MSERGSTQHSTRLDEELHKETESLLRGSPAESRAEEWRLMEPPAEGEPLPDARVTVDDVELRSLLAISLRPSAFPGDRARLLAVAEQEHAEDRMLEWLRSLPATETFANVEAVWETLGGAREQRSAPVPAAEAVPVAESAPDVRPAIDQSIVGRVRNLAIAGIELAVGLVIEAVVQVRRRL